MSIKKEVPQKEELEAEYQKEGTTISSLARLYGTSNPTVRSWLIKYDIERKSQKQASIEANNRHKKSSRPTKDQFLEVYEEKSLLDTRKHFSVGQGTLYEWIEDFDIEKRSLSESAKMSKEMQWRDINFSKEFLSSRYDRTKPLSFLAGDLGVSVSHIRKLFDKHEIEAAKTWRSKREIEISNFCKNSFPEFEWNSNDKSIINPYELDIVNATKKIAIEYCGMFWHAETFGQKSRDYHQKKFNMCLDKGYKLITIFESDNQKKVESLLNSLHGKNQRVYARNTVVKEIDSSTARIFNEEHHLSGSVGAKHHYGLFLDGMLLMVASFGKCRFNKKYEFECNRMTSHSDYSVVGGASKLFNHFINEVKPRSLLTYADLRFGNGKVYEKCGMSFVGYTNPNYWYFHKDKPNSVYSRVKFQKHKLEDILKKYDPSLTEYENMLENKWDRIWDCGNAVYGLEF